MSLRIAFVAFSPHLRDYFGKKFLVGLQKDKEEQRKQNVSRFVRADYTLCKPSSNFSQFLKMQGTHKYVTASNKYVIHCGP